MTDRRKLRKCYTFCLDDQVVPLTFENAGLEISDPNDYPERLWKPASQMAKGITSPIFGVGGERTVSMRWVQSVTHIIGSEPRFGSDFSELARKQLIATVTYD